MNTIRDDVSNALSAAQSAIAELSRVLTNALGQVNDISEENARLHEANRSLTEQNASLRNQVSDAQSELWQVRREGGEAKRDLDNARADVERLNKALDEAKAEAVKLREVILNVAAATDGIINPKPVPEVAKPEPVHGGDNYQSHGFNG